MSIALVLSIIYYVSAVIATNLFSSAHPEWFGNLGRSLYAPFQVMTLESWSMGIVRPVMETFPFACMFLILFILIASFTMLNLFIAIIVNAMQSVSEAEQREAREAVTAARDDIEADLCQEMFRLREEIADLRAALPARDKPS